MHASRTFKCLTVALVLAGLALAPHARVTLAAPSVTLYQVTDLGTLGGPFSQARAINNRGQIVGFSLNSDFDLRAFLWQAGAMRDLGTLAGNTPGFSSTAFAINPSGAVTGGSDTPSSSDAYLYRGGGMLDLGTLGGDTSQGEGINASEQVAGESDVTADDPVNPGNQQFHAFLWSGGLMADLGTLGTGTESAATGGINDAGQVAGFSTFDEGFDPQAGGPDYHAFLWSGGRMNDLGTLPGGNYSQANAINNGGQEAGYSEVSEPDPTSAACVGTEVNAFHPALWQNGSPIDLGPLPGDADALAFGMNNTGQVVGRSGAFCGPARATLWQNGTGIDLNTVIPATSGWYLLRAFAINDLGQITGAGISPSGHMHAYLLTPIASGAPHTVNSRAGTARANAAIARLSPRERGLLRQTEVSHRGLHS
jgi:probable HAF family extracellular repeat protein